MIEDLYKPASSALVLAAADMVVSKDKPMDAIQDGVLLGLVEFGVDYFAGHRKIPIVGSFLPNYQADITSAGSYAVLKRFLPKKVNMLPEPIEGIFESDNRGLVKDFLFALGSIYVGEMAYKYVAPKNEPTARQIRQVMRATEAEAGNAVAYPQNRKLGGDSPMLDSVELSIV